MVKEGIVLGHKVFEEGLEVDKAKINVISKLPPPTNIKAQQNYTMTEKELMAIVFAFDKFRSYLVLSKTIVHTDHLALRHLFKKQDVKPCLIRWIMLLQEFDIKIKDRKCTENVVADHLSRIENEETSDDNEVEDNFPGGTLMEINTEDDPWFTDFANYLASDIIPKGMTYQQKKFFSQTSNTTSGWNPTSKIATDYVSKWAEVQALPTNDARVVITFLKKLLCGFGMPKALISDKGTHFCNKIMEKTMKRYGVNHRFSTSYHPHTSVKVENTNKALKRILEKTVKDNPTIWSRKLDDAPWTFYLIAAGEKRMFQLHELDELRHQAYENSRYKFKQPKLKSRWLGPYVVKHQYPSGYVELYGKDGKTFIINGHQLKLYHEEDYNGPQSEASPLPSFKRKNSQKQDLANDSA
ncbi:reverse transcriptase domain-containing protein [Tanacetum coccineum]|uniref:Reverse transcriptase domain-containing protein n=1 Tax=Tanacetum coccineum TaxID=301880 RepID=A0ABQ5DCV8_9ASTR